MKTTCFICLAVVLLSGSLAVAAPAPEPKRSEPGDPLAGMDTYTPEFQKLRESFGRAKAALDAGYEKRFSDLLQQFMTKADDMLAEKERLGNVKGIAIARTAKKMFEDAGAELKEKHSFNLPDKVRKELESLVEDCRTQKANIEKLHEKALAELEDKGMPPFVEIVKRTVGSDKELDPEALKKKFLALVSDTKPIVTDAKPILSATPPGASANPKAPGKETVVVGAPERPVIIGMSGTGQQWIAVAQWTVKAWGMDVFTIPVMNRTKNEETRQFNPEIGSDSVAQFRVLYTIPARTDYAFRLMSMPSHEPVGVAEWPTARNQWSLMVRTQVPRKPPAEFGFELQVSLPGANGSKLLIKSASDKTASAKPGGSDRAEVMSPTLSIAAAAPSMASNVLVKKSSRVTLEATGTWKCGSTVEECGPQGYPKTTKYSRYYSIPGAELRPLPKANYAALLVRIGQDGPPMVVGKKVSFVADRDGPLCFDINETLVVGSRKDNEGSMEVTVSIEPNIDL